MNGRWGLVAPQYEFANSTPVDNVREALHFAGKSGCYGFPFLLPSKPAAESASGDFASSADQGADYRLKNGRPQSMSTSLGKNQHGRSPRYARPRLPL